MNPEGRLRHMSFLAALSTVAMAGGLNAVAAEIQEEIAPRPDRGTVEHQAGARERRYSLRQSSSGLAKAKRARSRI